MQLASPELSQKSNKLLFPICDGTGLVYALPRDKNKLFRSLSTETIWDWTKTNRIKEQSARLHAWAARKNSRFVGLFADFDTLPERFKSWEQLSRYLEWHLDGRAIVIPSFSGKVKAFFLVDINGRKMTQDLGICILEEELPPDLFNICDLTQGAMSISFLNAEPLEKLHRMSIFLKPITYLFNNELPINEKSNFESKTLKKYRTVEDLYSGTNETGGDLSSGQFKRETIENLISKYQLTFKDGLVNKFIKFALATSGLINGFCIHQEMLGNTLGISRKRAGRLLKKLAKIGIIEKKADYIKGYRAIEYRAKDGLLEALKCLYANRRTPPTLPTKIADGEWNQTIKYYGLRYFNFRPFELIQWIKTIPGHKNKDRIKQAESMAKWIFVKLRNGVIH